MPVPVPYALAPHLATHMMIYNTQLAIYAIELLLGSLNSRSPHPSSHLAPPFLRRLQVPFLASELEVAPVFLGLCLLAAGLVRSRLALRACFLSAEAARSPTVRVPGSARAPEKCLHVVGQAASRAYWARCLPVCPKAAVYYRCAAA